jgi:hypothetical protein
VIRLLLILFCFFDDPLALFRSARLVETIRLYSRILLLKDRVFHHWIATRWQHI